MHPLLRDVVIGVVGLLIAGALAALALLGNDPDLSVIALLSAAVLAAALGLFLYAQGWIWGTRTARRRETGQAIAFALGGGLMILVGGVALAGLVVLLLLFVVG